VDREGLVRREGIMYLLTGWKKFARDHDVEVGCLLNFFYEGDGEIKVKVYDKESCRIHYHNGSGDDIDDDSNGRRLEPTSSIGFLYALYWCLPRFLDVLRRPFQCFKKKATKHL
jgi:hypothetical protein